MDSPASAPTHPTVGNGFVPFRRFFRAFVNLNKISIIIKPAHDRVCDVLQKAALGTLGKQFVVINIPPRFGKTKICEALAAWQLAYFPDSHMIYTSYSANLAEASVRYVRETLQNDWYKTLFPETRLGGVQKSDYFQTGGNGCVYGAGTGGSITGFGAGLKRKAGGFIVIDDPTKPDEATSKVLQESVTFWLENTLKSRRNSPNVPIILCMQRLASDDLSGYILDNYPNDTELIKIPALVNGESIMPETVSTESLRATERVNPFAFNAQYQQDPVMLGGNLVKTEWLQYYSSDPDSFQWEMKIITSDTAMKAKQHNDHSVLQCWGRLGRKAYLIDHVRGKMNSPELLAAAHAFFTKHNTDKSPVRKFVVEEAAAGPGLIQQLHVLGIPAEGVTRVKDKVARVMDVLAFVKTGMVYHPRDVPWRKEVEAELGQFRADGESRKDDIVDTWADGVRECLGTSLSILDVLGPKRAQGVLRPVGL